MNISASCCRLAYGTCGLAVRQKGVLMRHRVLRNLLGRRSAASFLTNDLIGLKPYLHRTLDLISGRGGAQVHAGISL